MPRSWLSYLVAAEIPETDTVLDVGCGPDSPLQYLPNPRHGLDAFPPYLDRDNSGLGKTLQDVRDGLPFRDGEFDTVAALDVLEHLEEGEAAGVMREMERVAGDRVIVFTTEGFVPQSEDPYRLGGDAWQIHRCGFTEQFFKSRGYDTLRAKGDDRHTIPYAAIYAVKRKWLPTAPVPFGKVSVVIPTLNRPKLLAQAIESVKRQTYRDFEIIVVDDGGSYDVQSMVEDAGGKYVWKENGGTASALNRGIREASGEWIKWLSDDDFLHPRCLELMLSKGSEDIRYCPYFIVDVNGVVQDVFLEPKYSAAGFAEALKKKFIGNGSSTLIHRRAFDVVGLFNEDYMYHEDYEWWLRAAVKHGLPFELVDYPLLFYRRHTQQLTNQVRGQAGLQNDIIRRTLDI